MNDDKSQKYHQSRRNNSRKFNKNVFDTLLK